MAILEHEVRSAESSITGLHRHLFSRDEYYAMANVLHDMRVELIEGEIIEMAPIGPPHAAITYPISELLSAAFGPGFAVRNQAPIALGDDRKPSEPEPDVAVVTGSWRDYLTRQPVPADIKLIVEVAESSLNDDRTIKAMLYAAADIPEYWIVNLIDKQLEVYRNPSGSAYRSAVIHHPGETVEPLSAPGKPIALTDFMP